jgi:hypothetical protein
MLDAAQYISDMVKKKVKGVGQDYTEVKSNSYRSVNSYRKKPLTDEG